MRLSSAESGAIGSSGSASESTSSSSSFSSRPPSLTRSSATTVPTMRHRRLGRQRRDRSLSSLGGSSLASTTCARPVSSRSTTNCTASGRASPAPSRAPSRARRCRPSDQLRSASAFTPADPIPGRLLDGAPRPARPRQPRTRPPRPSRAPRSSRPRAGPPPPARARPGASALSRTSTRATGARIGRRASDLALRTSLSTSTP